MNMKLSFLVLTLSILALTTSAQSYSRDSSWVRKGIINANLSQSSLSNWSAGGESAVGLESMLAYDINYKKGNQLWNNRFEFAYGLNYTDNNGTRKTNDKIYVSSTYGYQVVKNLYASALLSFQSQFAKGYNYDVNDINYISRFLSPGYLTVGAGATWTPKPYFTATISPATWRGTFVRDDSLANIGAYGVDEGDHLLSEFGANVKMEVTYEFLKNMTIYSRLNLYSNYLEDTKNVDVAWDVILNMKINSWFSASITTNLIYDNDQKIEQKDGTLSPKVQFKEVLGVGLHFSF
ncbi:DUF3078 domain-containing protein [Odoribacter sp. OttesenSCG-928-G04]|nr:DUF3078 domain-containing protein [Odoribacter sp. OttesenSCG-928-G04]MDL2330471.1 DUF3078 domain-containing protein [Odoribacter sp. OttesenSCG-928-A06]